MNKKREKTNTMNIDKLNKAYDTVLGNLFSTDCVSPATQNAVATYGLFTHEVERLYKKAQDKKLIEIPEVSTLLDSLYSFVLANLSEINTKFKDYDYESPEFSVSDLKNSSLDQVNKLYNIADKIHNGDSDAINDFCQDFDLHLMSHFETDTF